MTSMDYTIIVCRLLELSTAENLPTKEDLIASIRPRVPASKLPTLTEVVTAPVAVRRSYLVDILLTIILDLHDQVAAGTLAHKTMIEYLDQMKGQLDCTKDPILALYLFSDVHVASGGREHWCQLYNIIFRDSGKAPESLVSDCLCRNRTLPYIAKTGSTKAFLSLFFASIPRDRYSNLMQTPMMFPYEWATLDGKELRKFVDKAIKINKPVQVEEVLDAIPEPPTPVHTVTPAHRVYLLRHIATLSAATNKVPLWLHLLDNKWSDEAVNSVYIAGALIHNGMCSAQVGRHPKSSHTHLSPFRGFNRYLFELPAQSAEFTLTLAGLQTRSGPLNEADNTQALLEVTSPALENTGNLSSPLLAKAHTDFIYKIILGCTTIKKFNAAVEVIQERKDRAIDWIHEELGEKLHPLYFCNAVNPAHGLYYNKNNPLSSVGVGGIRLGFPPQPELTSVTLTAIDAWLQNENTPEPTIPLDSHALFRICRGYAPYELEAPNIPDIVNPQFYTTVTKVARDSEGHPEADLFLVDEVQKITDCFYEVVNDPAVIPEVRSAIITGKPMPLLNVNSWFRMPSLVFAAQGLGGLSRGMHGSVSPGSNHSQIIPGESSKLEFMDNLGEMPELDRYVPGRKGVIENVIKLKACSYRYRVYPAGGASRG